MDLGLAGARALVQGGTQGMGRSAAECFAVEGARVAVLARTRADLDATAAHLRELGAPEAIGLRADITRRDEVEAAFSELGERWGELNILVNATGPSEDFSKPGRVWYPVDGRDSFPLYEEIATAYHEGLPGHHLQIGAAGRHEGGGKERTVEMGHGIRIAQRRREPRRHGALRRFGGAGAITIVKLVKLVDLERDHRGFPALIGRGDEVVRRGDQGRLAGQTGLMIALDRGDGAAWRPIKAGQGEPYWHNQSDQ